MTDNLLPFRSRSSSKRPDTELLAACSNGDRGALEELFRRHGDQIRRILARLRYVAREDMDDVLQTTFLQIYRSANAYSGRATVSGWMVGIAMNVVSHYVRAESRRKSAVAAFACTQTELRAAGPHDTIANQQLIRRLEVAFDALPPDVRIVFTLCDLEEMRSVDVARALEIPEGTVWRRLHNARRRLRQALGGEWSP